VGPEIEEREEDREWFLDAYEAIKGPFTVKLNDRLQIWRITIDSTIGDDMLAGVVAL
jgi:hypothetical protein